MHKQLDAVLDRVIDHQSGSPLSRVGLVERFRLQPDKKRLLVFCRIMSVDHACCMVFNNTAYDQTIEDLRNELTKTFPNFTVQFIF